MRKRQEDNKKKFDIFYEVIGIHTDAVKYLTIELVITLIRRKK